MLYCILVIVLLFILKNLHNLKIIEICLFLSRLAISAVQETTQNVRLYKEVYGKYKTMTM